MGRQRTPIGTFGEISYMRAGRKGRARTRYRDDDGRIRRIQASGATEADAVRRLKAALAQRESRRAYGELSPDSSFTALVKVWLEDLDLDGELARSTRDLYERDMRTIVLPAFEHPCSARSRSAGWTGSCATWPPTAAMRWPSTPARC
jgi:hypothetical protein